MAQFIRVNIPTTFSLLIHAVENPRARLGEGDIPPPIMMFTSVIIMATWSTHHIIHCNMACLNDFVQPWTLGPCKICHVATVFCYGVMDSMLRVSPRCCSCDHFKFDVMLKWWHFFSLRYYLCTQYRILYIILSVGTAAIELKNYKTTLSLLVQIVIYIHIYKHCHP
jgi:hypothetical protein